MPTYEYQCIHCHHRFDLRQGFADPPEAACPRCGSEARRQFQPPAIVFKGNGWYSTDHRRSSFESPKDGDPSDSDHNKEPVKAAEPAASAPKAESAVDGD